MIEHIFFILDQQDENTDKNIISTLDAVELPHDTNVYITDSKQSAIDILDGLMKLGKLN